MSDFPTIDETGAPLTVQRPKSVLLGRSRKELEGISASLGEPAYRGRQLARWLYERRAATVDEMSDLPRAFRMALAERFAVGRPGVLEAHEASDLTTKFLVELWDGAKVETVLLPYEDRVSVCVSSQVGCAAGCVFCATATMGFTRNLTPGEIVGQVLTASEALDAAPWKSQLSASAQRVNHVVFMGMGEPLWNLENVIASIHLLNDEMGIGMRGITVSTVGIPDAMRRLAAEKLQVTLAVSLHAGTEETRQSLVPTARKYDLDDVIAAAREYFNETGRRVTFEYVVLGGVNDTEAEAWALAARLRGTPAHVNLIPWNPALSRTTFRQPRSQDIHRFKQIMDESGISVTQRKERGRGIAAACGQLTVSGAALAGAASA